MPHTRGKPGRNFSSVKLYDAQEEEASQQEKNKFFIGGFSVLKLCTLQFKNPYRFIDTDLATMLQAAALGCGPCQDKIVEITRSLSFLKFSNPKKRNDQGKTFRLGLHYEIKDRLHQPWKG
jgi:hypothetical protein